MFSSTVQFSKIHTFFDFFFKVIEMYYIISFFVCQALFFIFFIILCFCDLFAVMVYYYTLFFLFVKCFFILFLFFIHFTLSQKAAPFLFAASCLTGTLYIISQPFSFCKLFFHFLSIFFIFLIFC